MVFKGEKGEKFKRATTRTEYDDDISTSINEAHSLRDMSQAHRKDAAISSGGFT